MDDTQVPDVETTTSAPSDDHSFDRPGDQRENLRADIEAARDEVDRNEGVMDRGKTDEERVQEREERREHRDRREQRAQRRQQREAQERGVETPQAQADAEQAQTQQTQQADEAPSSWRHEAKAKWSSLPSDIRQEITRREQAHVAGVEQLKNHVMQRYGEIDQAITPYLGAIQAFGKRPGEAVAQLFGWFDSLARQPDVAVPALLQSYNYQALRLARALGYYPQQLQNGNILLTRNPQAFQQQQIEQRIQQGIQQAVAPYQSYVTQQAQEAQQYYEQQNTARTQEMLDNWSKDKPHYNTVRQLMGHYLSPVYDSSGNEVGESVIPLKNGRVDLDSAYRLAVATHPALQAQRQKVKQATRAASSISPSAPGLNNGSRPQRERPRGTVRDAIRDAIAEVANR